MSTIQYTSVANLLNPKQHGLPKTHTSPVVHSVVIVDKKIDEQGISEEAVKRGQVLSGKGATPETPHPAVELVLPTQLPIEHSISEAILVHKGEEELKEDELEEKIVILSLEEEVTKPSIVPERVEYILNSIPHSPVILPTEVEVSQENPVPHSDPAPCEPPPCEPVAPNIIPERVEYIHKKPHVSFATPPTPPVSPPRESFAIPAGLRLPPVPIPASILTPPLSPQIPPIDNFVGIEEVTESRLVTESDEKFEIDADWEHCAPPDQTPPGEADHSSTHSTNGEGEREESVARVDTEEDRRLREHIREVFEDDTPLVVHVEDIAHRDQTDDEMQVENPSELIREEPSHTEVSRSCPPDPLQPLPHNDGEASMTTQEKPALIILTPETEESRVLYDAANSRHSSIDSHTSIIEEDKQKTVDIGYIPTEIEQPVISPSLETNGITFSDPFSSKVSEIQEDKTEEAASELAIIKPESELVRGPYIESDDETLSIHVAPEVEQTSDELMSEITAILKKEPEPPIQEDIAKPIQVDIIAKSDKDFVTDVKPTTDSAQHLAEEIEASFQQSKNLPSLLISTPLIPEDEELVIPERRAEDGMMSKLPQVKVPSRPSTAKTTTSSGSDAGASSSSIDFSSPSSLLQRSDSVPSSVVRTTNSSGDPTLFYSETNANAPATPAANKTVDEKKVLPERAEIKRLNKIEEEGHWVDVAIEAERSLQTYTVLLEEKENHFKSGDQSAGGKQEIESNPLIKANNQEKSRKDEAKAAVVEKNEGVKSVTPIQSTAKRPFSLPFQIQPPPRTYNPGTDYLRNSRAPSSNYKQPLRRVHFDVDDMVAPDSPMFVLPIPPSIYNDRPGSRDSAFSNPSNVDRNLGFVSIHKPQPLTVSHRIDTPLVVRDAVSAQSGLSIREIDITSDAPGGAIKPFYPAISDWVDLERGMFHDATPKESHDFARDSDVAEWLNITREQVKTAAAFQQQLRQGKTDPMIPLHYPMIESEVGGGGAPPRRRWTLLRALSIPFSAFRSSTDSPRSPTTPITPTSATSPQSSDLQETVGFLTQFYPQSPSTPQYPPSSSLLHSIPLSPTEQTIPSTQSHPLPIRFLKKLSPKGLISGATGAARKAWGLVKFLTSATPTSATVPPGAGVVERRQSINWVKGLEEMEAGRGAERVLIELDEDRRNRTKQGEKKDQVLEELREIVVI